MKRRVRQFKGTSRPRAFYDRKVRRSGYSRVISISKIIPEDWLYVRLTPLNRTDKSVEVLIEALLRGNEDAQTEKADKEGE